MSVDVDAAKPARGSGLLHNMSARPTTEVTRTVPPLRAAWVWFRWRAAPALDAASCRELDAYWSACGFRGAALVHPLTAELRQALGSVARCGNELLTSNVLLRLRGSLLLASMPLLDSTEGLARLSVATDDPRLVALSGAAR